MDPCNPVENFTLSLLAFASFSKTGIQRGGITSIQDHELTSMIPAAIVKSYSGVSVPTVRQGSCGGSAVGSWA